MTVGFDSEQITARQSTIDRVPALGVDTKTTRTHDNDSESPPLPRMNSGHLRGSQLGRLFGGKKSKRQPTDTGDPRTVPKMNFLARTMSATPQIPIERRLSMNTDTSTQTTISMLSPTTHDLR